MSYFGEPTARIAKMKEDLLNAQAQVCVERAIYTTEAYKKHKDKLPILKRAYAIKNTLDNMTIFIEDGGLLAGNQASVNRAAPIFPEYAIDWVIDELDEFEKRDGDAFYISEENKKVLREIAPFWEGQTVKDKGLAHIGIGGATGDDKAIEAVKMAVASPLLETTINGASHVIINISGDISLMDANDAASYVQDLAGDDANIIFGAKYDESIPDAATITVIATGLENAAAPAPSILPGMKFNGGNTLNMARTAGSVKPAQTSATPVQPQFNGIQRPQKPTPTVAPRDIKIPEFLKNTKR